LAKFPILNYSFSRSFRSQLRSNHFVLGNPEVLLSGSLTQSPGLLFYSQVTFYDSLALWQMEEVGSWL